MAITGNGREYDITFIPESKMLTTTSQYMCCGLVPDTTTSADRTVSLCGQTGTLADATGAAWHFIGINQSRLSAASANCDVRLFGVSKATCAESIAAGSWIMPYYGVSTTTMMGRIVKVDNGVSMGGSSIAVHGVIIGRALENGSTGTVISVFVNSQLYDMNIIGTIGVT